MQSSLIFPYNYIAEAASLLLAGLLLFVMLYTTPKKTYVYRYLFNGTILSILACILQISILVTANDMELFYNNIVFPVQLILFLMVYNGILFYIFSYVNTMSMVRRNQRREFLLMYAVLSIIYVTGVVFELASGNLYKVGLDGIDITHFTRFYSFAGIVTALICMYATVINKPHISRVIWHTVCIIVPTEIIVLLVQILIISSKRTIFTSITYVPVFMLAFLIFHNIPYDEESGCQSNAALDEFINRNAGKKLFYLMFTEFMMPTRENYIDDGEIKMIGINACRAIEKISNRIRMYRIAEEKFVNIIDIDDETMALHVANQIRGVFDGVKAELKIPFNYVMITTDISKELDTPIKIRQFSEFVAGQFEERNNSNYYVAQPIDHDKFADVYEISQALKDIRNRLDYDDDRVVVYAQPIYSVEDGAFRVAEALMRIKVNGKIFTPDKFIPIAEQNGCIHALTCIMLDKVCREVQILEEYYDFDAISINVSSKELSQTEMNREFLEIIERYDIDVSKIRMEITESAMFENYEVANENMEVLDNAGVQLYLDDFGTGYSSFERVMNCPVRTIKFDKTLLYKSLDDDRMDEILSYMIEVFKKNGFVTLVEGVEDENQNQYSMNRGFDYIQGYHYAKPGPIQELKNYFTRKSKF